MRIVQLGFAGLMLVVCLGHVTAVSAEQDQKSKPLSPVVLVANGSGGQFDLSRPVLDVVDFSPFVVHVETVRWSRFGDPVQDHADHKGQTIAAQQMAQRAQQFLKKRPDRKIILMGFSSGCRVVLDAARMMPPDSLERVIVFAPSVHYAYNLGPALRASRQGIDSYYSNNDMILENVVSFLGTADGYLVPAAGRIGFWIKSKKGPDADVYMKRLRQHIWHPQLCTVGHRGGHFGWTRRDFLYRYVLELIVDRRLVKRKQIRWGKMAPLAHP
ncbi:MAG: cutinase family protein [Gemmataceae bacterium]